MILYLLLANCNPFLCSSGSDTVIGGVVVLCTGQNAEVAALFVFLYRLIDVLSLPFLFISPLVSTQSDLSLLLSLIIP